MSTPIPAPAAREEPTSVNHLRARIIPWLRSRRPVDVQYWTVSTSIPSPAAFWRLDRGSR